MSFSRKSTAFLFITLLMGGVESLLVKKAYASQDLCLLEQNPLLLTQTNTEPFCSPLVEEKIETKLRSKIHLEDLGKSSEHYKEILINLLTEMYEQHQGLERCKFDELLSWGQLSFAIIPHVIKTRSAAYDPAKSRIEIPETFFQFSCPEAKIIKKEILAHELKHALDSCFNMKLNKLIINKKEQSFALSSNYGEYLGSDAKQENVRILPQEDFFRVLNLLNVDVKKFKKLAKHFDKYVKTKKPAPELSKLFELIVKHNYQISMDSINSPTFDFKTFKPAIKNTNKNCHYIDSSHPLSGLIVAKKKVLLKSFEKNSQSFKLYFHYRHAEPLTNLENRAYNLIQSFLSRLENVELYKPESFTYELAAHVEEIFSPYSPDFAKALIPNFYNHLISRSTSSFKDCLKL